MALIAQLDMELAGLGRPRDEAIAAGTDNRGIGVGGMTGGSHVLRLRFGFRDY
jgi:hypothetical protein